MREHGIFADDMVKDQKKWRVGFMGIYRGKNYINKYGTAQEGQ